MNEKYKEFVEALKQELMKVMGLNEDGIFFAEKGSPYTPTGDRILVTLAVHESSKEVCGIYVEELFDRYTDGTTMEEIVNSVIGELTKAKEKKFFKKTRYLLEYPKIKDDLMIRPVNKDKNEKELEAALYRTVGDIALVLYLNLECDNGCVSSMKIREEYVELWEKNCGITREEIFDAALANTARLAPPRVFRWKELLFNSAAYKGEEFLKAEKDIELDKGGLGNCISTVERTNGAVAVFFPNVAEKLAELLGGDFLIGFTSVNEAMVHCADTACIPAIKEVLRQTIENTTPEEEQLTFHVYRYCAKTKEFICL